MIYWNLQWYSQSFQAQGFLPLFFMSQFWNISHNEVSFHCKTMYIVSNCLELSGWHIYIYIYIYICDILSSMMTHTRNWSSAFNPSKCTHTAVSSEHTHCEHAPGTVGSHCSSTRGATGGWVPCSRAPQSWYWRWRECCSFTIPTFNPCRTWGSNPQPLMQTSLTLDWITSLTKFFIIRKWFCI